VKSVLRVTFQISIFTNSKQTKVPPTAKLPQMTQHTRRSFLQYVGFGVAAASLPLGPLARAAKAAAPTTDPRAFSTPTGQPLFTPVAYPIPIPGDGGSASTDAGRLAKFTIVDDVVLPPGYEYKVVVAWGDRLGPPSEPLRQFTFGFNADYTGLHPIAGTTDEFFLIVNHEYISARPWLQGLGRARGSTPLADTDKGTMPDGSSLSGLELDLQNPAAKAGLARDLRDLCMHAMDDLGISIVHVRRLPSGHFQPITTSDKHFKISAYRTVNAAAEALSATGPAAPLLGTIRGTFSNCSGATTPWGTFLTCEENFQDQVNEFITPDGKTLTTTPKKFAAAAVKGHPLPFEFEGLGTGVMPPLDGRQYGWVAEIDPIAKTLTKHTLLGRFRHENVAIHAVAAKPLAAYMGDDRRGGHVWKYLSRQPVTDPASPSNTALLTDGTLYAARFTADYRGQWLPLTPTTPLARPTPEFCPSGHMWLPQRPDGGHIAVGTKDSKSAKITVDEWIASVEAFTGKPFANTTLGDLYPGENAQAVILMDAYAAANAIGATPSARPEDLEVHPLDQSIYIAFTDSTGSGDGSPDFRIFPDSRGTNSRQYGAIYRVVETGDNPHTFTWGKFVSSGEVADGGGGFACADNLVFDPHANLWMVCDITTTRHNFPVNRTDSTAPGASGFVGLFGNNAVFFIPTAGDLAGIPHPFATGPMDCELTGPTFTPDGHTLLLAVQHPGELHGSRQTTPDGTLAAETRIMRIAGRDGQIFEQARTTPLGSRFAADPEGVPRPAVISIVRTT
jgi:secreted PhoX family phosphatase